MSLLDCHCHLDRYPDPHMVARRCERERIVTIGVTNSPREFAAGRPHVESYKYVRLALGFHPLLATRNEGQLAQFAQLVGKTSFVGEIGLDFSREGRASRDVQLRCFKVVLRAIRDSARFVSLHSRGAEEEVLAQLAEFGISGAVFHWFSGSARNLSSVVDGGHYFSVNPAMARSRKGKQLIERMPADRVLTETDGPYVQVRGRPARPEDVEIVANELAHIWRCERSRVLEIVRANLGRILSTVGHRQVPG